jgi:mono/diheme cytochrome c family protein
MRLVAKAIIIWVVALSAAMFAAGVSGAQTPAAKPDAKAIKNPVAATPKSIAAGQATFQKYCKFCHGADAKGDGPMAPKDSHPPNLTDDTWKHGSSDSDIFQIISGGAPPPSVMKGFKSKLTAPEMWNVVNYLRSLHPKAAAH